MDSALWRRAQKRRRVLELRGSWELGPWGRFEIELRYRSRSARALDVTTMPTRALERLVRISM